MTHEKVLEILAWLFTISAIVSIIHANCSGSGISLCALLLTLSLIFQTAYAKEIKKNESKK